MAKFAANHHVNTSIGITPFFADYSFHPRTSVESPQASQENNQRFKLLAANKIVKNQKMALFLQD